MKDNLIEVKLWGQSVGLLSWNNNRSVATFQFDNKFASLGWNISPLSAPLSSPYVQKSIPLSGNKEKLYGGLPEFLADSLPDRWGNEVFQKWMQLNRLQDKDISPVDRLAFIGRRAMGALEFYPARAEADADASTDIKLSSLYELAELIFSERQNATVGTVESLVMEDLYRVGTSAGGQRPKAIIALDKSTGSVRSGQADLPDNFTHCILKFDTGKPSELPVTRIEMACYLMAIDAGVEMMPSKLIEINGRQHFLTERFDRAGGAKLHTQTLAAMSALADSYEDLFVVGRRIGIPVEEQTQQYRRMVFNVLAENVDDHSKNFAFLMSPDGKWHISPAYDILFSADPSTPFFNYHELSIRGKKKGITKSDLLTFADQQNVRDALRIIDEVTETVSNFSKYADLAGVPKDWTRRIEQVLQNNVFTSKK